MRRQTAGEGSTPPTEKSFYPVIYVAERDDDWCDGKVWQKVNTSFGITVNRFYNKNFISSGAEKEVEAPHKRVSLDICT